MSTKYGARVYFYSDGVVLVKQTIKRDSHVRYVLDVDSEGKLKERFVDPGPDEDRELGEVIRLAGKGQLSR